MRRSWRHVALVWQKELLDTIRDRRTLTLMIVVPLVLTPVLVLGPNVLRQSQEEKQLQQLQTVAVVNGQEAPELLALLRESGLLRIRSVPDSDAKRAREELEEGEIDAVVEVPEGFAERIAREAEPPEVVIRFDVSRSQSRTAREKLAQLLRAYRERVVAERLKQRGLSPQLLQPFTTRSEVVQAEERVSGFLLSMLLPLFLVLWAAVGGSQTAIDVTAGEKERGTLESLLVAPPKRSRLVVGKFLTITTVTLGATTLSLLGFALSLTLGRGLFPESSIFSQFGFAIRPQVLLLLFGVTALLAALMSALTFTLYLWTRNFKEAQTYASYLSFAVMFPAFLVSFTDPPTTLPAMLLPVYNVAVVIKELLLGDIRWDHIGATLLSSGAYLALSLALAVKVFQDERVLFRQ